MKSMKTGSWTFFGTDEMEVCLPPLFTGLPCDFGMAQRSENSPTRIVGLARPHRQVTSLGQVGDLTLTKRGQATLRGGGA